MLIFLRFRYPLPLNQNLICDVKTIADDMNIDFAFTSRSVYFANELEVKNNAK